MQARLRCAIAQIPTNQDLATFRTMKGAKDIKPLRLQRASAALLSGTITFKCHAALHQVGELRGTISPGETQWEEVCKTTHPPYKRVNWLEQVQAKCRSILISSAL